MSNEISLEPSPELQAALERTIPIIKQWMESTGNSVERWLVSQWHAGILALPEFTERMPAHQSKVLADHLAYIALCMGRIGMENEAFTEVALGIQDKFHEIFNQEKDENGTP